MDELPRMPAKPLFQVMARDPAWVFAYWTLPDAVRRDAASAADGDAQWAIRFVRLGTGDIRDVSIDPDAGNWYIEVGPGGRLAAELGLRLADGAFRPVVSGNEVEMPRPDASDLVDPDWYVSEEDFWRLLAALYARAWGSPRPAPDGATEWREAVWPLCPLVSSHEAQKKPRAP